jgi:transcription-repair coupling factor (superfamily II helicase)
MDIKEELVDRFGDLPEQAQSLFETHRLRLNMSVLGIKKIDANPAQITIQFIPNPPIDPIKIIQLVQTNKRIQLNGQDKLKILPADKEAFITLAQRLEAIRQLLKHLSDTAIKPETLKTS